MESEWYEKLPEKEKLFKNRHPLMAARNENWTTVETMLAQVYPVALRRELLQQIHQLVDSESVWARAVQEAEQ